MKEIEIKNSIKKIAEYIGRDFEKLQYEFDMYYLSNKNVNLSWAQLYSKYLCETTNLKTKKDFEDMRYINGTN